jgi:hypothetical protein
MTEQGLDVMKWMLDFCTHTRLQMLQFFRHTAELTARQCLALRTFHGHVTGYKFADSLRMFCHAFLVSIAKYSGLLAMQQRVRLRHIGDIPRRADDYA